MVCAVKVLMLVGCALIDPLLGANWSFVRCVLGAWKFPHFPFQFEIDLGHQVLVKPICFQGLAKSEQVLGTIISFQRLRHYLAWTADAPVT